MKWHSKPANLKIELFWKRALFFWGFIVAAFAAIGVLKEQQPTLSLLVSGFGFVCSFAWTLVNRGSKYWQEQWETKVEKELPDVSKPLFRTREPRKKKGWWGGFDFSVSKVAIAVSDYVTFVWLCILSRQVWLTFTPYRRTEYTKPFIIALCVIPFVYAAFMLGLGRRSVD